MLLPDLANGTGTILKMLILPFFHSSVDKHLIEKHILLRSSSQPSPQRLGVSSILFYLGSL